MGDSSDGDVPAYHRVEPDPAKDPPEYSYVERRAEVLDFLVSEGTVEGVSQRELADRYDVSTSTISRDIDRLGDALGDHFRDGTILLGLRTLRSRVVADLLNEDDWRAQAKAWEIQKSWAEFLGVEPDRGAQDGDGDSDSDADAGDAEAIPEHTREQLGRKVSEAIEAESHDLDVFRVDTGDE